MLRLFAKANYIARTDMVCFPPESLALTNSSRSKHQLYTKSYGRRKHHSLVKPIFSLLTKVENSFFKTGNLILKAVLRTNVVRTIGTKSQKYWTCVGPSYEWCVLDALGSLYERKHLAKSAFPINHKQTSLYPTCIVYLVSFRLNGSELVW